MALQATIACPYPWATTYYTPLGVPMGHTQPGGGKAIYTSTPQAHLLTYLKPGLEGPTPHSPQLVLFQYFIHFQDWHYGAQPQGFGTCRLAAWP